MSTAQVGLKHKNWIYNLLSPSHAVESGSQEDNTAKKICSWDADLLPGIRQSSDAADSKKN